MNDVMRVPGFLFSGVSCGIKTNDALDLGIVYVPKGATLAGVYTKNQVVAAPVLLSRSASKSGHVQAIVVNSGNANACTGAAGEADALEMVTRVREHLDLPQQTVQVCSTGVIGQTLPMEKIRAGIDTACQSLHDTNASLFAEAIRTTDQYQKVVHGQVKSGDKNYRILGIAKGAGMIAPNMATMLAFVFTDAPIAEKDLHHLWHRVCDQTFNAMTVDGGTSTNDTALIASSQCNSPPLDSEMLKVFEAELLSICDELAHLIVGDGEGATKAVRITVSNALTQRDAHQIADVIASSPLVKTALHGQDPNWGRFIAAAGRSGVDINPKLLSLAFDKCPLYEKGQWCGLEAERSVCEVMKKSRYEVVLDLNLGTASSSVLTCDLSAEYVRINADYRS